MNLVVLKRVYELLESRGMKPAQLANELGLSNSAFTDWKKGKGKPSLDAVIKFSEYFDVPIDYLVKENVNTKKMELSRKDEEELIEIYRKLPEDTKKNLLMFAKGMEMASPQANNSPDKA